MSSDIPTTISFKKALRSTSPEKGDTFLARPGYVPESDVASQWQRQKARTLNGMFRDIRTWAFPFLEVLVSAASAQPSSSASSSESVTLNVQKQIALTVVLVSGLVIWGVGPIVSDVALYRAQRAANHTVDVPGDSLAQAVEADRPIAANLLIHADHLVGRKAVEESLSKIPYPDDAFDTEFLQDKDNSSRLSGVLNALDRTF